MVGARRNLLSHGSSYSSNGGADSNGNSNSYTRLDLESGYGSINSVNSKQKFRDAIKQTIDENRAMEMKTKLIENVDHEELEHFRKSNESVRLSLNTTIVDRCAYTVEQLKCIKNKKVRGFYEEQNRRLDAWLEVDMIVSSLADDIVDSMHPRDTDGDGVAEERGPLGSSGENLEPFLPEDEREKRRKSEKHVKWAINVGLIEALAYSTLY
jgi:hypothetical protein